MASGHVDGDPSSSNATLGLFEAARDQFLGSLSPEDRQLYSPCASSDDFAKALDKLKATVGRTSTRAAKGMRGLYSLNTLLKPYFEVVGIFIQSNPEVSALFWGALRLVLELSSRVATFFDKLLELIAHLRDAFPRYTDVVSVCRGADSERIRHNVAEVYTDMLEIFQAAVKVFSKKSGQIRRTPMVLGALLWKPFDIRFSSLIQKMEVHKENIEAEVSIWRLKQQDREYAETAVWRDYVSQELKDAKEEYQILKEERRLAELEKNASLESRREISVILREIQAEKRRLEERRLEETVERIQRWLDSRGSVGIRELNSRLREPNTGEWILDHPQYKSWIQPSTDSIKKKPKRRFGSNMLWVQGHPGSGKSVLATFLLDNLEAEEDDAGDKTFKVLYHFFHFDHPETRTSSSAFRSLLLQVLWQGRHDPSVVDRFLFLMTSKTADAPSLAAESPSALVSFLQTCVDGQTAVVIDGVDECTDSDEFITGLLKVTKASSPRVLALSRIHVAGLQLSVPPEYQLPLPKSKMEQDIRVFSYRELLELVEDGILPDWADECLDELTDHMAVGADGMFLWARLMITFIRSPAHSQDKRVAILKDIEFPEGLERMYQRIFHHIKKSGETTYKLAKHVLTWLKYRATAMSTKQTRQALSNAGAWFMGEKSDCISEFEKAALIACAGLVEITPLSFDPEVINILKFTHFSVKEVLSRSNALFESENGSVQPQSQILSTSSQQEMNLRLATQCLQQLLYHTPTQPLAAKFGTSISAATVGLILPFTDYAALYWMHHTTESRFFLGFDLADSSRQLNPSFLDAYINFSKDLKRFLESPKSLSTWLEVYYTTQAETSPSGGDLRKWASWLSEMSQRGILKVNSQLLGLIFEFRTDLDRIVTRWDDRLRLTPHIVWDEAAAINFSSSSLFFCSGSTRITSRAPQKPSMDGMYETPLITTSATSSDGLLLGVLALWDLKSQRRYPPGEYLQNPPRSYWLSYELWPIDVDRQRIATLVAFAGNFHVPPKAYMLSISLDTISFSVCDTIWRLLPGDASRAKGLASHIWPIPVRFESYTFDLTKPHMVRIGSYICFSPTEKYVILAEEFAKKKNTYGHKDYVIELQKTAYQLSDSKNLSSAEISELKQEIKPVMLFICNRDTDCWTIKPLIHPTLPLAIMSGLDGKLYTWHFQDENINFRLTKRPNEVMNFSTCGKYIVAQESNAHASRVIRLPSHLFNNEPSADRKDLIIPREDSDIKSIQMSKISHDERKSTSAANQLLRISNLSPGSIAGTLQADFTEKGMIMSTLLNDEGVQLRVEDDEAADLLQVSAVPKSLREGSRAEIKLPDKPADSVKIIFHNQGMIDSSVPYLPIVIERDPRFTSYAQDSMLLENRETRDTPPLGSSQDGRLISAGDTMEPSENNESDGLFWWARNRDL